MRRPRVKEGLRALVAACCPRKCRFAGVAGSSIYLERAEIVRVIPMAPGTGRATTLAPEPALVLLAVWGVRAVLTDGC